MVNDNTLQKKSILNKMISKTTNYSNNSNLQLKILVQQCHNKNQVIEHSNIK